MVPAAPPELKPNLNSPYPAPHRPRHTSLYTMARASPPSSLGLKIPHVPHLIPQPFVPPANTSSVPLAPHAPADGGEGGGRGLPDPVSHYDSLILLITPGQAAAAATPLISRTTATQIFEVICRRPHISFSVLTLSCVLLCL